MDRNPFTFRFWDLLTLAEIDKLPLDEARCGKEVCADGSFAARLDLTDPNVQKRDWRKATVPGRILVGVDYLGMLLWGGVLWGRRYQRSTGQLQLAGAGPGSYWNKRKQALDYTGTWAAGAPPMQIVKRVMADANAVAGAVKVTVRSSGELGSTAIVSFPLSSPQMVKSIVERLAEMGPYGGFDYLFDVEYEPGTTKPMIVLTMRIPMLGALYKDSGLVVLARDCVDFEWPEDATSEAWKITGVAGGGLIEEVEEPSIGEEGVPLLEDIVSKSSTTNGAVLTQEAAGELFARARPIETPSLILPLWDVQDGGSSAWVGFKDLGVGDELKFRVDPAVGASENTDPRFPDGLDEVRRATNWAATIVPAGLSTMTVALNLSPLAVTHAEYQTPEFSPSESKKEQEEKEELHEETEKKGTEEEPPNEEKYKEETTKDEEERLKKYEEKVTEIPKLREEAKACCEEAKEDAKKAEEEAKKAREEAKQAEEHAEKAEKELKELKELPTKFSFDGTQHSTITLGKGESVTDSVISVKGGVTNKAFTPISGGSSNDIVPEETGEYQITVTAEAESRILTFAEKNMGNLRIGFGVGGMTVSSFIASWDEPGTGTGVPGAIVFKSVEGSSTMTLTAGTAYHLFWTGTAGGEEKQQYQLVKAHVTIKRIA